ncbi:MAG: Do family serine endopeptidase [Deltaproteobacteria bacterium]|nr:Do family serine endopeptidase [Deltaproteobacteria bacterium]
MHSLARRSSLFVVVAASSFYACQIAGESLFAADAHAAPAPAVAVAAATPVAVALAAPAPAPGTETLAPLPSLAPLVKRLRPVVVNINAKFKPRPQVKRRQLPGRQLDPRGGDGSQGEDGNGNGDDDGSDDPMERYFRFFGGPQQPDTQERRGLGSGFLIGDGLVITNNHVVQVQDSPGGKFRPMDEVKVLTDEAAPGGTREFVAKVIGADPKSDLALLRLDDDKAKSLPGAVLGDSDALEVGDYVVAIGEPFGLQATVTSGIVSAKERNEVGNPYSDYLQTDASINPGNSGGPLFNLRGEVVGVNSAIIQGANTIGFAIPIAVVKQILPQLREKGRVARGFLGVAPQGITRDIADQLGLKSTQGALVADVVRDSPAEKAGLKAGDVILAVNGKSITDNNHLTREVGLIPPGDTVKLDYVRKGKPESLSLKVAQRPDESEIPKAAEAEKAKAQDLLGVTVEELTPDLARRLRLDAGTKGALITDVSPDSPAANAGLEPGDLLVDLGGNSIANVSDFRKVAEKLKKGDTVLARVRRGQGVQFLTIKIGR